MNLKHAASYFNERRVEHVGIEKGKVAIKFEGGGVIRYEGPAPDVVGRTLQKVEYNETETVLHFNDITVHLDPMTYSVSDPSYTKGVVIYPERDSSASPADSLPPDPSDDRTTEGVEE